MGHRGILMIVEPDFLTHWKTQMLINELGDKSAPLYVIALWAHCQSRRSDTFSNLAPNALKAICRFEGEASKLRSALERCGFLDVDGEATVVHGWAETNAKLLANWTNGAIGGRPRKTQAKPNENPPETQNGIGVTQPEPIEKRREDEIVSITQCERAHEIPTVEQVTQYARSAPVPISEACAVAFHDTQQASGWITKHGHSIADWRAALRRYASMWNENEKAKPGQQRTDHRQNKAESEYPEPKQTKLPRL